MSIETLRALALSYAPTAEYFVCLDRDKQLELVNLRRQIIAAEADARSDRPTRATMGEESAEDRVERLRADLDAAQEAARPVSMALVFKRLAATQDSADDGETSYRTLEAEYSDDKGRVDLDRLADALLPLCFLRAESDAGEDVGLSWAEASRPLDAGDLEQLRQIIIGHHRIGASIPFDPRSSGQPG